MWIVRLRWFSVPLVKFCFLTWLILGYNEIIIINVAEKKVLPHNNTNLCLSQTVSYRKPEQLSRGMSLGWNC